MQFNDSGENDNDLNIKLWKKIEILQQEINIEENEDSEETNTCSCNEILIKFNNILGNDKINKNKNN